MQNKELAAMIRQLADRVEACQINLGPIEDVHVKLDLHSAPNPLAAVDALTDSNVVADEGETCGWYCGRLGHAQITAFFDVPNRSPSLLSEVSL